MMGKNTVLWQTLLTAIASLIWGSTYLVTTEVLPPDIPLTSSILRSLPAGLLILLFYRQFPTGQWWFKILLLGLLNIGAFFYCLFVAAYHLPGGIAALVMSIQPILIILYNTLIFKRPATSIQILACGVAILGVAMIVLKGQSTLSTVGILAGIAGALSMATGVVLTKYWGRPQDMSLIAFTGWQLLFGGISLLPIAFLRESFPAALSFANIAGFLYLGLIGALLAYVLWFRGIERLPALSVSFIALLSPLSAVCLGYIFLSQSMSTWQILGGAILILSIILVQSPLRLPLFGRRKL